MTFAERLRRSLGLLADATTDEVEAALDALFLRLHRAELAIDLAAEDRDQARRAYQEMANHVELIRIEREYLLDAVAEEQTLEEQLAADQWRREVLRRRAA